MDKPCLVPIGRVIKPHGVRGAVKILAYGDTLGELEPGEKLLLVDSEGNAELQLTPTDIRPQKKGWIGKFDEIDNMDDALPLAGREIFIPRDRLPLLPEGEYYHFELIGLSVETKDGESLGTLCGIFETGGNDVYVVDCGGKELLVPAIEDVICSIDLLNRKIIVDLPEGLE